MRDTAYRIALATRYPAFRRKRGAAIFAFHNVVADDEAPARCDTSLHVSLSAFQDYLAVITHRFRVVPLAEIAARIGGGLPVEGLAALTFDDAYTGVLRYALPTLAYQHLPATLFVVSGAAAAPVPFWWDLLGKADGLSDALRERALGELQGDRDAVLSRNHVADLAMPLALLPASWHDVRKASRSGIAIGSHTATHRNLLALGVDEVREELERSHAEIGAAVGRAPDMVSYPYGYYSHEVIEAARQAGYRAGVTMRFGLAGRGAEPLALPRINVPAGISVPALECWAAGLRLHPKS
jgi:peptidoglycan/xylan/chitin deacetylase (PgdA/CDA1 family)